MEKSSRSNGQLALKALFFIYYGGIGQFFAFLNVYYNDIGLTGTQIGIIGTIVSLIGIFSTTLWGMLSDNFGKTRWLFLAAFLGTASGVLVLSGAQTFGTIITITCLFSIFSTTLMPLLDSTALGILGPDSSRYSSFRIWGSLGFIATSSSAGFIYDRFGLHAMFPIFIGLMLLAVGISMFLPDLPVQLSGSAWGGIRQMIRQPAWVILAGCAFFTWLAVTGMLNFLGVTIKTMGGSDSLVGLAGMLAAVLELPFMLMGEKLLKRFGAQRLIVVGCGVYAVRMGLYAIMPSPMWVLWIGLSNGVSYVPFWVGAVAHAGELAPTGLKATSQGLLFSIMNLASMVGALSSGWLFDNVGSSGLFGILAASCLVAFALFALGQARFKQRADLAT